MAMRPTFTVQSAPDRGSCTALDDAAEPDGDDGHQHDAFVGSWLPFKLTAAIIPLRVSERQELIGLDITQHDETVSSRGVRVALQSSQGELFVPTRDEPSPVSWSADLQVTSRQG